MNFLTNLLALVGAIVLVILALPLIGISVAVLVAFAGLFIWLLPILLILGSEKTTGGEKAAWILAIIFLSWFAWIFYFLLAPIKPRSNFSRY